MARPTHLLMQLALLFFFSLLGTINANDVGTATPTITPTILMGTAFIPSSHPKSLQGSIVAAIDGTLTYRLSCPTGTTPDNISCQKESRYPALLTHTPGSVFAGAFTTATPGLTTSWNCALGSGSDDTIPDQNGVCSISVVENGMTSITTTAMNSCEVARYQVPVTFTGGLGFLYVDSYGLQDGKSLASEMDQDVSQACKGSTSTPSTSVSETSIKGSAATTTTSSGGGQTTGSSTSSPTSSKPLPTNSGSAQKNGASRLRGAQVAAAMIVGAMAGDLP